MFVELILSALTATTTATVTSPVTTTSTQAIEAPDTTTSATPPSEPKTLIPGVLSYDHGFLFPGDIRLNGRFDLNYERVGYTDDLTKGHDALRNYHHFIFLSREGASDPFGFNVELVDLSYYDVTLHFGIEETAWRFLFRGGKIMVPFGAEPLFHHAYGGRSGFDQQILPIVWAEHGISGRVQYSLWGMRLSNDLYLVQGHRLTDPNAFLNLQSDISPVDEIHFAVGDRIGVSWGPIQLWYSLYINGLGFGQTLFMQALDLTFGRWRGIPVLENFELGVGVLRADISGGGSGADYYNFADYLQIRYYFLDWLYLQGRAGYRSSNNRRGFIIDSTRLDELDSTSYNIAIVARYAGLTGSLSHYWNLEEANEQDDDFLRLALSYDF